MRKRRRKNPARAARAKAWRELSGKLRAAVGACEVCGSTEGVLNVHHVLGRRVRPDLLLDENNLVCLCQRHHFLLHHGHEAEFLAWLRGRKPCQWVWVM